MKQQAIDNLKSDLTDYLVNTDSFYEILCEDCSLVSRSEGCPFDDDCFFPGCPQHNTAWAFVDDIAKICVDFGLHRRFYY